MRFGQNERSNWHGPSSLSKRYKTNTVSIHPPGADIRNLPCQRVTYSPKHLLFLFTHHQLHRAPDLGRRDCRVYYSSVHFNHSHYIVNETCVKARVKILKKSVYLLPHSYFKSHNLKLSHRKTSPIQFYSYRYRRSCPCEFWSKLFLSPRMKL